MGCSHSYDFDNIYDINNLIAQIEEENEKIRVEYIFKNDVKYNKKFYQDFLDMSDLLINIIRNKRTRHIRELTCLLTGVYNALHNGNKSNIVEYCKEIHNFTRRRLLVKKRSPNNNSNFKNKLNSINNNKPFTANGAIKNTNTNKDIDNSMVSEKDIKLQ